MIKPLAPQSDHVDAWLNRIGNMEFIGDQLDCDKLNPVAYWHGIELADATGGRVEFAFIVGL